MAQLKDKVQNALNEGRRKMSIALLQGFWIGRFCRLRSACAAIYSSWRKVTGSAEFALAASVFMLVVFYGLWFGFTAYRRGKENRAGRLGQPLSAD